MVTDAVLDHHRMTMFTTAVIMEMFLRMRDYGRERERDFYRLNSDLDIIVLHERSSFFSSSFPFSMLLSHITTIFDSHRRMEVSSFVQNLDYAVPFHHY